MTIDRGIDYSAWLRERMPYAEKPPLHSYTIGVRQAGRLVGVIGLYNWVVGNVCFVGCAGDTPRWLTRPAIATMLDVVFRDLKAQNLVAFTSPENARARGLLAGFGFKHVNTEKNGFQVGVDRLVYCLDKLAGDSLRDRIGVR
jgi:RimJ/RimL family protein N-acetyltransferase